MVHGIWESRQGERKMHMLQGRSCCLGLQLPSAEAQGRSSHPRSACPPHSRQHMKSRTFSVETKSAVSRSVNWLIWSTIVAILGFAGAAASDDCHRRAILCCAKAAVGRRYEALGFAVQTQRLRAREAGADMTTETGWRVCS